MEPTDAEILAFSRAHPLLPYTHVAKHLGVPTTRVYRIMHPKANQKNKQSGRENAPHIPTPAEIRAYTKAIRQSQAELDAGAGRGVISGQHNLREYEIRHSGTRTEFLPRSE